MTATDDRSAGERAETDSETVVGQNGRAVGGKPGEVSARDIIDGLKLEKNSGVAVAGNDLARRGCRSAIKLPFDSEANSPQMPTEPAPRSSNPLASVPMKFPAIMLRRPKVKCRHARNG